MLGGALAALVGRNASAEVSEHVSAHKMFQFQFAKTSKNEGQNSQAGITVYTYTMYVKTDAPTGSPVLVSFTGSGNPGAVTGINAEP